MADRDAMRHEPAGVATRPVLWTALVLAVLPLASVALIALLFAASDIPAAPSLAEAGDARPPLFREDHRSFTRAPAPEQAGRAKAGLKAAMRAVVERPDPYAPVRDDGAGKANRETQP